MGHKHTSAVLSDDILSSGKDTLFVQRTAKVLPKNAETTGQACDYCKRHNKICRPKVSGTCFNCAERKKKCKYSGESMSMGRKHVTRTIEEAETQSVVPQPSIGGAQHASHSNSGSLADPATGLQERAILLSHARLPREPSSSNDRRDSYISVAASTLEDDVELPPSRTIRSSSLLKRNAGEAWGDESAKRLRVVHSR